jgi:hypothetical protein
VTRKKSTRGAEIMAYRNGQRAGIHGRARRRDRANSRRKAITESARG